MAYQNKKMSRPKAHRRARVSVADADIGTEARRRHVESALGSLRIEGLEASSEAREITDRYISGDIPADEMTAAILARHSTQRRTLG